MSTLEFSSMTQLNEKSYQRTKVEDGNVLELDDVKIWYHDSGGDGEPIVLLGGFTAGHFVFDFVREHLQEYRLITWEPRGLGLSQAAEGDTSGYSTDVWADDLSRLLAAIGVKKAHLWADGFGGFIAMKLAAQHPDLVQSVITSTEVWAGLQDRTKNWNIYSAIVNNLGTTGRGAKLLAKWMDIETLPWFVPWEAQNISEVVHVETVESTVGYGLLHADVRDELPRVTAPTLLLLGAESTEEAMAQPGVNELREGVPHLEIGVVTGAHASYGVVTHPKEFADAAREFFQKNGN
ncbi:alpha/beta fold hydrolase [Glutamicibacter uratoxydans]|uniref:alpha/beta fold hydrolase n=1 Tax=Glutamicibacter uratoxydans TaxID=43667 RepID=UPI003D6DE7CE